MKCLLLLQCLLALLVAVFGGGSIVNYETKFFSVPVDHFSFANNATFKLRYLINDTFWKPDRRGPIFFYTGNEGDIITFCENTGLIWEAAPDFNALIVFAEHRYYGSSMPFENVSYSDASKAGYLTSSQALADYVDLIEFIKSSNNLEPKENPVIVFGGSYGGMLASWMRMKYPAVVTGAIAASAPIWQFTGMTPCYAFNRVTTSAYQSTSESCYRTIKKSWKVIDKEGQTDEGKSFLTTNFKICKPLKSNEDVKKLKDWLTVVYTNIAMVNYPYPSNFLADLPGNPVKVLCSYLDNSEKPNRQILGDLFKAVSIYFNGTGNVSCLDLNLESNPQIDVGGWDYQACTEMIMPMCGDGERDMFDADPWNLTSYLIECRGKYKVQPQAYLVEKLYGGKDLSAASNIIFSNGLLDPWSSGGVLNNISKTVRAVLIPEGAHHLDLRFSNPADPVSVRIARKYYREMIKLWIHNHHVENSARSKKM